MLFRPGWMRLIAPLSGLGTNVNAVVLANEQRDLHLIWPKDTFFVPWMVDICSACTVYRVFFHQSPSVAKMQGEIGKTVLIVVQCCSNVVQMLFNYPCKPVFLDPGLTWLTWRGNEEHPPRLIEDGTAHRRSRFPKGEGIWAFYCSEKSSCEYLVMVHYVHLDLSAIPPPRVSLVVWPLSTLMKLSCLSRKSSCTTATGQFKGLKFIKL